MSLLAFWCDACPSRAGVGPAAFSLLSGGLLATWAACARWGLTFLGADLAQSGATWGSM